jgi:serine/threonine-protein kinase
MAIPSKPEPDQDPLIGSVVGDKYKILRKIGEGGMGSVYLAEHLVIEKKFALKVLNGEMTRRSDLVARFLQEARSASRIDHENVIDISDFGQSSDGLVFIAMEFLQGKDLGEMVRSQGAMAWQDARDIILQICRALRAAHEKGIVHRDMKPENIFIVQREGQPHFVKILDFGIAKIMGLDPNGPRLTRTGMIFGTPEYMAPEQAEGKKDIDHRVDVYAVGCILYHLITGQTPFIADSFMTMLTKHLMEEPVPPSVRRPDLLITPEMDKLVLKALEKDRNDRWQSMSELLDVIARCPESEHPKTDALPSAPLQATPVPHADQVTPPSRKKVEETTGRKPFQRWQSKVMVLLLLCFALIGIAGAVVALMRSSNHQSKFRNAPENASGPSSASPSGSSEGAMAAPEPNVVDKLGPSHASPDATQVQPSGGDTQGHDSTTVGTTSPTKGMQMPRSTKSSRRKGGAQSAMPTTSASEAKSPKPKGVVGEDPKGGTQYTRNNRVGGEQPRSTSDIEAEDKWNVLK